MNKPLYLDHHATTPLAPEVLHTMLPYFMEHYGNAGSRSHAYGWTAEQAVDSAREQVARLIGSSDHEIVFTSGATESNNLALIGALSKSIDNQNPCHIITSATEHKSVLDTAQYLASRGCELTVMPVDAYGMIDLDKLKKAIRPHTSLISVMWANNEIGTIQPISAIGALAKEREILFHCDAAQAAGLLPIDVQTAQVDLLSISAHKMYGPKGVGALYVRRRNPRVELSPLFHGGGQERNLRSGTLNVPGIVGLGVAADLVLKRRHDDSKNLIHLRDRLHTDICKTLEGVHLNGHPVERLPNNLNLSFEGVSGEALLSGLRPLAVSSGSACLENLNAPSYVLAALGLSKELTSASIRFGLGRQTSNDDITKTAAIVCETVQKLRNHSSRLQFN